MPPNAECNALYNLWSSCCCGQQFSHLLLSLSTPCLLAHLFPRSDVPCSSSHSPLLQLPLPPAPVATPPCSSSPSPLLPQSMNSNGCRTIEVFLLLLLFLPSWNSELLLSCWRLTKLICVVSATPVNTPSSNTPWFDVSHSADIYSNNTRFTCAVTLQG